MVSQTSKELKEEFQDYWNTLPDLRKMMNKILDRMIELEEFINESNEEE